MLTIRDTSEVFEAIEQVKAGASAFCTNLFPVEQKLRHWITGDRLLAEVGDGVALFLRKDRDFWHLYFSAANEQTLQRAIGAWSLLRTERVIADLVGREASLGALIAVLESEGFRRYNRLIRLVRMAPPSPQNQTSAGPVDTRIGYAQAAESEAVVDFLAQSFDRYAEQLPMPNEIAAAAEDRHILVARCDGALAALLFFETQGYSSTVRYWLVAEAFRDQRFGAALMHEYFALHPAVRRFILWVIADNENAIARYRHYGYAPDGLVDHVLANGVIR